MQNSTHPYDQSQAKHYHRTIKKNPAFPTDVLDISASITKVSR